MFEQLLIGDCLEKFENKEVYKTKEAAMQAARKFFSNKITVKFIYNLFRYLYSGYVSIDSEPHLEDDFVKNLNKMKSTFKEMGFDTADLQTSLAIDAPKIGK